MSDENKLIKDRIIYLDEPIYEKITTEVIAKFLFLADVDSTQYHY